MPPYDYKGIAIHPLPHRDDSGRWTIAVALRRDGKEVVVSGPDSFGTKGEAVFHCISFGKKIIDGEEDLFARDSL